MLKIILWTFCLYAGLKFGHLVAGAGLGFGRSQPTLSARLRAGEPLLLIGVLSLSGLVAVYATWWTNRFLEGHYAYASDCYSKLAASHVLPGRPARFGSYQAAEAARWYVSSAEIHGARLGMGIDVIDRSLDQGRVAYSDYFTKLASGDERGKIAASFDGLDRCLKDEGSPRGELLNPV